jgi:hypothetical protein
MYISLEQAVNVYDQLRDAMEGKAGYGSDTIELYAYRLMQNLPSGRNDLYLIIKA